MVMPGNGKVISANRKGKVIIANRDPESEESHTGWLVVNCCNGRQHYYRKKEPAISEARKLARQHGGEWEVRPTYDPGPYTKPGAEKDLVG